LAGVVVAIVRIVAISIINSDPATKPPKVISIAKAPKVISVAKPMEVTSVAKPMEAAVHAREAAPEATTPAKAATMKEPPP
jgi:hypothetical protein